MTDAEQHVHREYHPELPPERARFFGFDAVRAGRGETRRAHPGTTSIERSTYYTDSVNMNGNRAQANNYTLDGIDMNETFNNLISYSPAPESLQEIKVLTANSPADYGNVNGGGVVSILKSGTNSSTDRLMATCRITGLNANSWSNNHAIPIIPVNPYSQSQFGGTFGGPIMRDKLFFFVDYLGSRYHKGGTGRASVFTQAMRNGDFSALLAGSNPIQLYDPQNGFAPYSEQGCSDRQSGGQIPVCESDLSIRCRMRRLPTGLSANNLPGAARAVQGEQPGRHQD